MMEYNKCATNPTGFNEKHHLLTEKGERDQQHCLRD